jgi:hypothetical protein
MDPTTIIVGVLVKVLTSALQAATGKAVGDLYDILKKRLSTRYGAGVTTAIVQLEADPQSVPLQRQRAVRLDEAGAGLDEEILRMARELSDLIENPFPEEAPDPVEVVYRARGVQRLDEVMREHVQRVLRARAEYAVDDADLLTRNLRAGTAVPAPVRSELDGLHERIRDVIERIARAIEDGKYEEAQRAVAALPMARSQRHRADQLIAADKQMHVSYQTLRSAVEFFSEFNREILARIEREKSPEKQSDMLLGNAVMISELTDFVIDYVERFAMRGGDDLDRLYADIRERIAASRRDHDELEKDVREPDIEPAVREHALADIAQRRKALDVVEEEWGRYHGDIKRLDTVVGEVRAKVPTLRIIRRNAEQQIRVLELISLLRFLKSNSEMITSTIDTLQGFRLAPLTTSRVRRLLDF